MLAPAVLYSLVLTLLQALGCCPHPTAVVALAHQVTALLVAQSLRPAGRSRALLSAPAVRARPRYQRAARALDRPSLTSAWLTPVLVRAALALVPPDPVGTPTAGLTHVALDSVRCGRWEIVTLGVVWRNRTLLVGWTVMPYPWPKGAFPRAWAQVITTVAAAWPADRPVCLLADRAFPSYDRLRLLQRLGWGATVRLSAGSPVTVDGERQAVRDLVARAPEMGWTTFTGTYGSGPRAVAATIVVGRGLPVVPAHQANPGSLRHRAAQHARRQQHVASKHRGRRDRSVTTDRWVVLLTFPPTTQPTVADQPDSPVVPFRPVVPGYRAAASYRRRWAIEGTYRDGQGGWDGQHGWDLEPTVARLTTAERVDGLVGLWALGSLIQTAVGVDLSHAPAAVRAVQHRWTTTGRLSVWARGRFALTDPTSGLSDWLEQTLRTLADRLAAAPAAIGPDASTEPLRIAA